MKTLIAGSDKSARTRKALIVLGPSGIGSTILGRAFSHLHRTVSFFGEGSSVRRLNTEILEALGGSRSHPGPFAVDFSIEQRCTLSDVTSQRWLREAVDALQSMSDGKEWIILADPTISGFRKLWENACEHAGFEPHFVLLYGNPIARRIRRDALRFWLYHVLEALEIALDRKLDCVVSLEHLQAHPDDALAALLRPFELAASELEEVAQQVRLAPLKPDGVTDRADPNINPDNTPLAHFTTKAIALLEDCERHQDLSLARTRIEELSKAIRKSPVLRHIAIPVTQERLQDLRCASKPSIEAIGSPPSPQAQEAQNPERKTIIIHYHLFKNAGTSIDEMLKRNFGERWGGKEFAGAGARRSNVDAVGEYLRQHPTIVALSSHTAQLPPPSIDAAEVIPVLFVRHPIDRLRSAYEFERSQNADTAGAKLAKSLSFCGYLRELLSLPRHRQVRNFHTFRLAFNEPGDERSERERAIRAIEKLPFVGLVEAYDSSVKCFEAIIRVRFPEFRAILAHKNASYRRKSTLEERLAAIEKELGRGLWDELVAANASDLEIYELVRSRYSGA